MTRPLRCTVLFAAASAYACAALLGCGRINYEASLTTGDAGPNDGAVRDGDARDGGAVDANTTMTMDDAGAGDDGAVTLDDGGVDAGVCDESPCRLVLPQCGCPDAQMCTRPIMGSAERGCRAAGTTAAGDACTFSTECVPGSACVRANGAGMCAYWCTRSSDCPMGSRCAQFTSTDPSVGACTVLCDPVAQTGCPTGMACYPALGSEFGSGTTIGLTICAGPGTRDLGVACTTPFECAPGAGCNGTCTEACVVGTTCPTGMCRATTPATRVGTTEIGYCP